MSRYHACTAAGHEQKARHAEQVTPEHCWQRLHWQLRLSSRPASVSPVACVAIEGAIGLVIQGHSQLELKCAAIKGGVDWQVVDTQNA